MEPLSHKPSRGEDIPKSNRIEVREYLVNELGVKESRLPKALRNTIIHRGKKGPLGQLAITRLTGLVDNTASRVLRKFEDNVGGKDDVAEKLEALGEELPKDLVPLLALLKGSSKRGLTRLAADAKAEPVALMKAYARGCIELGKTEAAIEAHRNLPSVIKTLYKMMLDKVDVCGFCGGTGSLHKRSNDHEETIPCNFCDGKGNKIEKSEHKEFAISKLLEVTKLTGKEPTSINVNTAIGVKVGDGAKGSYMERIMASTDQILFSKARTQEAPPTPAQSDSEPIEAEIVQF